MSPNSLEHSISLSIVIPCFNQGEFILDALSSVELCQEPIYEIIIVNDGSTDPLTLRTFEYLKDKGYFILDQTNQGLARARNNGIAKAKGRYILALDADNKIRPDYIYQGISILDRCSDVGIVYGKAEYFGEKNGLWDVPEFDAAQLILGNYIDACAVFRKTVWENCGGYDPNMPIQGYEDWDFWLGALEHGWKFQHVPEVLFDYRVRTGSMISFCDIPENRKQLVKYICTKHPQLYTANFAEIISQKEFNALTCYFHAQYLQQQLDQLQVELEQSRQVSASATARIAAMESSKFWRLRRGWFKLKRALGLPTNEQT